MPSDQDTEGTEQSSGEVEHKSVARTIEGAWDDAFAARGPWKVMLVASMFLMTVVFGPLWMLLVAIERAGYYTTGEGFHL